MGHRALVAHRRPDGTFTLRYAQWGRALGAAIGPKTPLGGPAPPQAQTMSRPTSASSGGTSTSHPSRRAWTHAPSPSARAQPRSPAPSTRATSRWSSSRHPSKPKRISSVRSIRRRWEDLVLVDPDDDPETLRAWYVETKSRLSTRRRRRDALTRVRPGDAPPGAVGASDAVPARRRVLFRRRVIIPSRDDRRRHAGPVHHPPHPRGRPRPSPRTASTGGRW